MTVRHAARRLTRDWKSSALALTSLIFGIGVNCAAFIAVNAVLLRPPAYRQPDRVVEVWDTNRQQHRLRERVSPLNARDYADGNHSITALALWEPGVLAIRGGDDAEPQSIAGVRCTSALFAVLGTSPLLGRHLEPADDVRGSARVVVISQGLWQRRFGARPDALGRTLLVNEVPHVIAGVMPRTFQFPPGVVTETWVPHEFPAGELRVRAVRRYRAIARLAPRVRVDEAQREMDVIGARLAEAYPAANGGWTVTIARLQNGSVDARRSLLLLMGAAGVVLLLTCANVGGLLFAYELARAPDLAVRAALGASRWRLLAESLEVGALLAVVGGVTGAVLAWLITPWLFGLAGGTLTGAYDLTVDWHVVLFALAAVIAAALMAAVLPAMLNGDVVPTLALRTEAVGRRRSHAVQRGLVVAQTALAVALVSAALLLLASLQRLWSQDPGFRPDGVLVVNLARSTRELAPQTARFYAEMIERLRAIRGVISAGAVTALPMNPTEMDEFELPFLVEGRPAGPDDQGPRVRFRAATPGYFHTAGIPFVEGRDFGLDDSTPSQPRRAIVNREVVRRYLDGRSPLGARVSLPFGGWHEIVGVVGDVRFQGLADDARPEIYVPHARSPFPSLIILIRTSIDPRALAPAVKAVARTVDPNQPIARLTTLDELVWQSVASERFALATLGGLGAAALLLSFAGTYGLLAHDVRLRTRELGVRLALGARRRQVVAMVMRDGLVLALTGIGAGTVAFALASDALSALLFHTDPRDPRLLALVAGLQLAVAIAATWLPARRAAATDPMVALRTEGR